VDDEQAIRESGRDVLGHFGFKVITAASGEEALELVKKGINKIDLTILDINMPGMGGYQCLKELLCLDPKLKVLIASGCSIDVRASGVMESGALGFIPKPYRISDLVKQIRLTIDSG
jgi:DNA-binding NtrC family response regulator